jgi:phage terminase small subunit
MKPPTKAKQAPSKSLTVRQERFCELIVEGKDGTAAYLGAGWTCSREAAKVSASRLLTLDNIKAKIAELRKPQTAESLIGQERALDQPAGQAQGLLHE